MKIGDYCTGIQHLGIPVESMEATKQFYEGLGFSVVYETRIQQKHQNVAFLSMNNLMLELYEDQAQKRDGAIDHVALDCSDIASAYQIAVQNGYHILSDGIEMLDFWEHGIRYFIIEGPNCERIELCQRM